MITYFKGPFIYIAFGANELPAEHTFVKLADGYSYERIFIHDLSNIAELCSYQSVRACDRITFPPVNSKSPSFLFLYIPDITKPAEIRLSIEKFGQIPDEHYFDNAFTPILVTGDDGNKYSE